ncbi:MAG: hypothetical protein N2489_00790 [Clostridia bacterium]|nr:hypothetical protein [Clostridia bacterium]
MKNIIIIIAIFTLIICGCSQKGQNQEFQQQQVQTEQQSEKVPEQLKSIEASIENIFKTLNGPAAVDEGAEEKGGKQPQGMQGQGGGQQDKNQESSNKKKNEESADGEGESKNKEGSIDGGKEEKAEQDTQQKQPKQQAQPQDPMDMLTPLVNSLHYQWNSYMPMAVKQGANRQLLESFSTGLNSLTNTIIGKNKTNTLLAASYLYAYIPDFYSLYRTSTSPEIKRVRHYTRNAMLNAMTANWVQADSDIGNLKSSWSILKNTIPKEQQENASKLDFSVMELEKVVREKNQPLVDIKGRVAMSNIQLLEKSMEKK